MLKLTCLLFWVLLLTASGLRAAEPSFTPLPDLPGGDVRTSVIALSANGEVAVGMSWSDLNPLADPHFAYPFRWTQKDGMVALTDLPGIAWDVSADGTVIVGRYSFAEPGVAATAFRWSAETGFTNLEHIINPGNSHAYSVSPDGRFIAGMSADQAVRWADGAVMDLRVRTTLEVFVSSDGSVASGTRTSPVFDAFRWTATEGVMSLQTSSSVSDMVPDGRLIVGAGFRWTPETGLVDVPFNPHAVSDDGRLMVGSMAGSGTPAIWFDGAGAIELQPFLTGLGLDLTGWRLTDVRAISGDGTTIAGHGTPPDPSMPGAWVAVIPEPSTVGLALVAFLLLIAKQLRRP
jgi:hypothetical protein